MQHVMYIMELNNVNCATKSGKMTEVVQTFCDVFVFTWCLLLGNSERCVRVFAVRLVWETSCVRAVRHLRGAAVNPGSFFLQLVRHKPSTQQRTCSIGQGCQGECTVALHGPGALWSGPAQKGDTAWRSPCSIHVPYQEVCLEMRTNRVQSRTDARPCQGQQVCACAEAAVPGRARAEQTDLELSLFVLNRPQGRPVLGRFDQMFADWQNLHHKVPTTKTGAVACTFLRLCVSPARRASADGAIRASQLFSACTYLQLASGTHRLPARSLQLPPW